MRNLLFFLLLLPQCLPAQDTVYARNVVNSLCDPSFYGRGYYKKGAELASKYIEKEMKMAGLLPLNNDFRQQFPMIVNRFCDKQVMTINKIPLKPGLQFQFKEFLASAKGSADGNANIEFISTADMLSASTMDELIPKRADALVVVDTIPKGILFNASKLRDALMQSGFNKLIFLHAQKLTWSVAQEQQHWFQVDILLPALPEQLRDPDKWFHVGWEVQSKLSNIKAYNVAGMVHGTEHPDTFLVFCAHYDHLGQMCKDAIYPGANDNAAGIAMLLDLARHYRANPGAYGMIFIAFGGEEAGLVGSKFYAENPIHPLGQTKFLFNLDLVGTGETGGTVVNATVFPREYALLDTINRRNKYLPQLTRRNKAANSDHYFFTELGIHSFFLYQSGPRISYHDVHDIPATLTLAGYNGTFRLLRDFMDAL